MLSSSPDWSVLASHHERLVDGLGTAESPDPDPVAPHRAAEPPAPRRRAKRPRLRRTTTSAAAVALGLAGAASVPLAASAQAAARPSWHIVKRVHGGSQPDFTAVLAVGKTGGWAFDQGSSPTAWQRSGPTWTRRTFPAARNQRVIAAGASSATNAWAFTDGNSPTVSEALHWNGTSWSVEAQFTRLIGGAVVLGPKDVWVFGEPVLPGSGLGTWHFNGSTWTRVNSGHGLTGGSALSAGNIWAFGGISVAHWTGDGWKRTSVKQLLPAKRPLNSPSVTAIYAQSATSVWAVGNGNAQDEGGPLVILHYNGHDWSRAAIGGPNGQLGGYGVLGQVASDGRGGLWIPTAGSSGGPFALVHYSGGHLSTAKLPGGGSRMDVMSIAAIPGTTGALAGGFTHAAGNLGRRDVAVILQYKS